MASSQVVVKLIGDASSLNKAFADSEGKAKGWSGKMSSAGKGLTMGLTLPIVAGAALATKAAAEEEQEMETLANSLRKNIPGATEEMIAANEDWITSMQNATGVADSEMRQAMQHLITSGMSLEDAQKNVAIAMDIAAAKGKPLATVTEAINKANNGNIGAMGRLGIKVKDAAGEYMSLDDIMATAEKRMGGSAAAAADTAAGRAAIMKTKMDDLTETIGSFLIPIMEKLVGILSQVFDWFNNLDPGAQKVITALIAAAAAIGPLLLIGAKLVESFKIIGQAFGVLSKLMMANPWVLLIAAIIALVVIIVMNWDKIVAYLKKVWAWIKKTSDAVWTAIKSALKAALDWIVKLFLNWTLPGLIIKHWDRIKAGVAAVAQFFKDTWNGVIDWFKRLPGRISSAVAGMWDGVKNAFRAAVNWIITKWNNLRISIGGGSILGVSIPRITIDTPNIPTFHQGGTFHASRPGGEGLAVLRDRERVLRPGQGGGGAASPITIVVNGLVTDSNAVGKAVLEALQRYQRTNGPLPLDVRLN